MSANNKMEDMNEDEEEALLKSDDENDEGDKQQKSQTTADIVENLLLGEEITAVHDESNDEDLEAEIKMKESNDDSDTSDDNDMDESDVMFAEYKRILQELEENKFDYDKYVVLCEVAHKTDDLHCIRNAYNLFATVYPLSPEIWFKYLSIETSVAQSAIEIAQVVELFRKALKDYYSIMLAIKFALLAPRTVEPELIWRELLGTYALDCLKGRELFKQYREYISKSQTMSVDERQNAYVESFLQELKYPLHNMEESYIEFRVFYEKNKAELTNKINWEVIDREYFKAKHDLQKIMPFEEKLSNLDAKCYRERGEIYIQYIKESDKFLDENVLQTIYERMVTDCCLNTDTWLAYINFIDYRDEFGHPSELQELPVFQQTALDVNTRALRNCTWSEKLYVKRMHLLEKLNRSREEVQEVLESSIAANLQTPEPNVAIWLEYLTYLRRHTDWKNEEECDILRKNFNLAWTILGRQWGVLADCNCEILQLWGTLEYGPLQDPKRGKELWTTVMESSDNATKSGLWIEFINFEKIHDLGATRILFRQALHVIALDNPPVIGAAWERFERCNGTIKSLQACIKECSEYIFEHKSNIESRPTDNTKMKASKSAAAGDKTTKRKATTAVGADADTPQKRNKNQQDYHDKRSLKSDASSFAQASARKSHSVTFKEHEDQDIDLTKDHLRIFLSNLDYNLNEDDIRAGLSNLEIVHIQLIRSPNGRSRGFGYLELKSAAEVAKALTMDRSTLNGRPVFISSVLRDKEKRQKFKYSDSCEPKKLFVKNLPHDATKEELEKIFAAFGKLRDVRLVYHKSGKFKNIAYVEYEHEKSAGNAVLGTDSSELRGHSISVAISAPPPKQMPTAPTNTTSTSKLIGMTQKRNKIFDEKPRMSLIPSVLRKKIEVPSASDAVQTVSSNGSAKSSIKKTNEDFRKMLLK